MIITRKTADIIEIFIGAALLAFGIFTLYFAENGLNLYAGICIVLLIAGGFVMFQIRDRGYQNEDYFVCDEEKYTPQTIEMFNYICDQKITIYAINPNFLKSPQFRCSFDTKVDQAVIRKGYEAADIQKLYERLRK